MNNHKTTANPYRFDWNLLICGPIVQGDLMVNKNGKVISVTSDFNCRQTIINNVRKWGHLFNRIILVTWTDQEKFISSDLKSLGIEFLLLEDPGRESSFCRDSRVRVMTTTAGGIKAINNHSQHVLRIRTDQEFNLNAMIQSHQRASEIISKNQDVLILFCLILVASVFGLIGHIHCVILLMLDCVLIFCFLLRVKFVIGMHPA